MTPRAADGASFEAVACAIVRETGAPVDGARIGTIDFETWFATHPQGARR